MSFFDKLKFWKKDEDEFDFSKLPEEKPAGPSDDLGMPELGPMPQEPQAPRFPEPETAPPLHMRDYQPQYPPQQPYPSQDRSAAQLEVINSKFDAIKAILSALEQRISMMERRHGKDW